jgi:uncharacterized protein YeaO (DUF488 family)
LNGAIARLTKDYVADRKSTRRNLMIRVKRVYDPPSKEDGFRVLVDRFWPRGLSKSKARVDLWLREISPSNELRKWYSHDPMKWSAFQERYSGELAKKSDLVERVRELETKEGTITLLFSSKEEKHNNAVALGVILRYAERGADRLPRN